MPEIIPPGDPFDGLDFTPLIDTYQKGVDDNGYFVRQSYWGPWADADEFMLRMLGQSYTTSEWTQQIPFQLPGNTRLFAREAFIENMSGVEIDESDLSVVKDQIAKVTIIFRAPQFPFVRGDDEDNNSLGQNDEERDALLWAEQEIDNFLQIYTLPGSASRWFESGKIVAAQQKLQVVCQTMRIFYNRYPSMPANIVRGYMGRINNDTFLGCPRGTVMFMGGKTRRSFDVLGRPTRQAGFELQYREIDWNKEPVFAKKADGDEFAYSGDWDYVVYEHPLAEDPSTDDSGPWRYQYANLLNMLKFIAP